MVLDLLVPVVLSLLGAWLVLVVLLVVARRRGLGSGELARFGPDVARLLGSLSRDPTLARGARLRLLLLMAYLASPIDLVPDFVPVLGYADDVIVAAVALRSVVRLAGHDALDVHWKGTADGLRIVRRLAGLGREVQS